MRIKNIKSDAWYDIPGYDGKYQINYYAQVRRVYQSGKTRLLTGYVKKSNGRQAVKLNCKEKTVFSLMRDTFIGKVPSGYVLYHKNGILTDDILSNIGMTTRQKLGKMSGTRNECSFQIAKLNSDGEVVEFYKSAREAGRQNHMSYQTILDRVNGKVKSLYAPDGFVYCKDDDRCIGKAIRRIELDNKKQCGVVFIKASEIAFEF